MKPSTNIEKLYEKSNIDISEFKELINVIFKESDLTPLETLTMLSLELNEVMTFENLNRKLAENEAMNSN